MENTSQDIEQNNITPQFLSSDFVLLILILLLFFSNNNVFSNHLQFLTDQFKQIKSLLDTADATVQALEQVTQIPNQLLK